MLVDLIRNGFLLGLSVWLCGLITHQIWVSFRRLVNG